MQGKPIIYVDPRRTFTAAFAEKNGGVHLQIRPGTDTALYNAIARHIIEQGWEDRDFIASHTTTETDLSAESSWRRARFGRTFAQLREHLTSRTDFTPEGRRRLPACPRPRSAGRPR